MQENKTNLSPTLEAILADLRQEGRKIGIEIGTEIGEKGALEQVIQDLVKLTQELVNQNYSDEQIAKITHLKVDQVSELRKSFTH